MTEDRRKLPTRTIETSGHRTVWLLGCHGGAGTTTLARTIPETADAGRYWPVPATGKSTVVLVTRSHFGGLRAAQGAARQWAEDGLLQEHVALLGLAVVADIPKRLPRPLKELLDLLSGAVPRIWMIDYFEPLRSGARLDPLEGLPTSLQRLYDALAEATWPDTLHAVNTVQEE